MNITLSSLNYIRVGVVSPELQVANIFYNKDKILEALEETEKLCCQLVLFPELAITGYTCGDLFYQSFFIESAKKVLFEIADYTKEKSINLIVGVPLSIQGKLFNCAAFISNGEVLGIVPKTFIPNTSEFYEVRWFASEQNFAIDYITYNDKKIPFGKDLLFKAGNLENCLIGIEICEDMWAVSPPSGKMCASGASVICNLSASNEILGKKEYRELLVQSQSARCMTAYVYISSGPGESTTDMVFSGHGLIMENGIKLTETKRFQFQTQIAVADIDLEKLNNERIRNSSFRQIHAKETFRHISFMLAEKKVKTLYRKIFSHPFVPADDSEKSNRCREIFAIQTTGLAKRLATVKCTSAVIGISGGLDSTLALLVLVKAFDKLGLQRKNIVAITMPGFGTTKRTKSNAKSMAELLGVSFRNVPISKSVQQHFKDIGHDESIHNITYENAQARERTQILMDIANQVNGMVIGTGDLSELALGWCTYNGDHMSMYSVNTGVPKTLVIYMVKWCLEHEFKGKLTSILQDICDTPISPELLPPDKDDNITQVTEDNIGPYVLHDFFLYYAIRLHFSPRKILYLAKIVWNKEYSWEEILQWLTVFYKRFFSQQFKRSCIPDGPKVGTIALSPRADWRMPSDATVSLWLQHLEELKEEHR